jgi:putative oxidoreductase
MPLPNVITQNLDRLLLQPWMQSVPGLLARLTLGALLINHGTNKVFNGVSGLAGHLAELGWPLASLQAVLASYTEFLGGIFLVVGLFTRLAAFMNVGLFTIIVFVYHGSDPFSDRESGILFLMLSLIVFLSGPGKISVDNFLFRKNATREQA